MAETIAEWLMLNYCIPDKRKRKGWKQMKSYFMQDMNLDMKTGKVHPLLTQKELVRYHFIFNGYTVYRMI